MILEVEIIYSYFLWHYLNVPKKIFEVIKNFLKFGLHYFSISFLFKTFFSHWHKYSWNYPKGFEIGKYFEVFISNLISRMIGMVLRTFLILAGIFFEILIFFIGLIFILFWFFLPIILFLILVYGIRFLFTI